MSVLLIIAVVSGIAVGHCVLWYLTCLFMLMNERKPGTTISSQDLHDIILLCFFWPVTLPTSAVHYLSGYLHRRLVTFAEHPLDVQRRELAAREAQLAEEANRVMNLEIENERLRLAADRAKNSVS